jgi:hypothetical protein
VIDSLVAETLCASCGASNNGPVEVCPSCGRSPLLGGRFRVLRQLGSPRSGDAYAAIDSSRDSVVLKVLSLARVVEPKEIELFERQYEILRTLDHPRVPKALALLRADWRGERALVIALESLPGLSLETSLETGQRFDEGRARQVLMGMLEILEYLHSRSPGILHRDIKPGNVLLGPGDVPSLVDFDTAREASAEPELVYETFVASAGYAPPEQVQGRSRPASDLYALGVTLIAALSRRHPTEIPVEGLRLRFEPYVNVSEQFAGVLRRLIEPDVDKRLQSVGEVRAALEAPEPSQAATRASRRKAFTWGALLLTLPLAFAVLRRTPVGERMAGDPDLVARGPDATMSAAARSWHPSRDELARSDVVWARAVVGGSAPLGMERVLGPPDHYRVPDRGLNNAMTTAWSAPTGEQWVTVAFDPESTAGARAILVVEASSRGGVARVDDLSDPAKPIAVWRGRLSEADDSMLDRILRIDLPKPRRIRTLRVYLEIPRYTSNPIDAIGLLVAEPEASRPSSRGEAREWVPEPGGVAPPRTVWAASVLSRSMEQRDAGHERILGAPDEYPSHARSPAKAWSPHYSPSGRRWIAVSFGARHLTSAILIYESSHPGFVVGVEDLTGREERSAEPAGAEPLWQGHLPMFGKDAKPLAFPCWADRARVLRIDLLEPRPISALRLLVDTGKGCYSQIDAIGLLPAGS